MEVVLSILALLSGCAVFIVGMNMMSEGLQNSCGAGMKRLLGKISDNRFKGVLTGAGVTSIIQSSGATTVMVVGFVNAGIITLTQAASIIMGANIGTTITGILASFSSFKITAYLSIFAFIGVVLMFFKRDRIKNIGKIVAGLGIVFIGLDLMSSAFNNPQMNDFVMDIISKIDFPILLIIFGLLFTALLQSSSAMTGIVIVMAGSGVLKFDSALFIILGTNIGTCLTAILASLGASANAKRASMIHLLFNLIGTFVFTIVLLIFKDGIVSVFDKINLSIELKIAIFHVIFNIITTIMLLPFIKYLVLASNKIIRDKNDTRSTCIKYIDDHILVTPSIASMEAKKEIENMFNLSKDNMKLACDSLLNMNIDSKDEIEEKENSIDYLNEAITKFLIKITHQVTYQEDQKIGSYFHVINDIERIGDHAMNILEITEEMNKNGYEFSSVAINGINKMYNNVMNMFEISYSCFSNNNSSELKELERLEEITDKMKDELSEGHYLRLQNDNCSYELTSFYTSIISNLERVGDHLVNVGYSIVNPTGTAD